MGWGGFRNILLLTTRREDHGVKMMEDKLGKKHEARFLSATTSKCPSKRVDSKISVVLIPTTMGFVAWLRFAQKCTFKNLQYPKKKKSHLPTKLCNNI